MSDDAQVDILNYAAKQIYIYGYGFSIIAGLFGNTINIIIFLTKLKDNVCSYYLIVGDVSNNIALLIYILPYVISLTYGTNGTDVWVSWCRLMNYIGDASMLIATYAICLTAIDRYFYTSRIVIRRRWSSKKFAKISILILLLVSSILAIPDLIHWYIDEEYHYCAPETIYLQYATYFQTPVMLLLFPFIILSATGYKTYVNMKGHVHPIAATNGIEYQRRRMNHQVSQMILIQILFFLIQTVTFFIATLYTLITSNWEKSNIRLAAENVCLAIAYVVYTTFQWSSFYIYYIQSPSFRANVHRMLKIKT